MTHSKGYPFTTAAIKSNIYRKVRIGGKNIGLPSHVVVRLHDYVNTMTIVPSRSVVDIFGLESGIL